MSCIELLMHLGTSDLYLFGKGNRWMLFVVIMFSEVKFIGHWVYQMLGIILVFIFEKGSDIRSEVFESEFVAT